MPKGTQKYIGRLNLDARSAGAKSCFHLGHQCLSPFLSSYLSYSSIGHHFKILESFSDDGSVVQEKATACPMYVAQQVSG